MKPLHVGWLLVALLLVVAGGMFVVGVTAARMAYSDGWRARGVYEVRLIEARLDSLQAMADSSCVLWYKQTYPDRP